MSENPGRVEYHATRPYRVFAAGLFSLGLLLVFPAIYRAIIDTLGFPEFRFDTLLATLVAAPPLFTVWMFRNEDKQKDIENARFDTQVKDFHRVEEWVTDEKLTETNPALPIAALHQLRPYLEGEHGAPFRRPAYEIYKAVLAGWAEIVRDDMGSLAQETVDALMKLVPPPHIEAIHTVIREILQEKGAWEKVFPNATMPLRLLNLLRADLVQAHLEGADLRDARLEGADLQGAHLDKKTRFKETVYSDETKWWDDSFKPEKDDRFIHIDEWKKREEERRRGGPV
jgi:hypothetical protein